MKCSLLYLIGQVICTPSYFRNVFSSDHQILIENPHIFNEFHAVAEEAYAGTLESGWKTLLEEVGIEELKERVKRVKSQIGQFGQETESGETAAKFEANQFEESESSEFGSSEADFEVLHHESGKYSLRSKTGIEALNLDTVKQYVGYFDIRDADKHFFYWFFESRNDPATDPIILWLNGGPGCASDGGLFFELGPSSIDEDLKPVFNPYAWNANASVIFLDQPVGVGYSYAGKEDVDTSGKAAADVYVFLELFFQKFPKFLNNKFHLSGESYAGHYVPRIAAEIIRHHERSFELASVILGNGAVNQFFQKHYDQKMICGEGGLGYLISPENCTQMEENLNKCLIFQQLCGLHNDVLTCLPSGYYCELAYGPINDLNLNRYDLRRQCEDNRLCYHDMNYVSDYMNSDFVKEAAGVPKSLEFEFCKSEVGERFRAAHDGQIPFEHFIAEVLDYGVPVLHYAGDKDYACHWLGYNAVSNRVAYKNQEQFAASEFGPWISSTGEEIGKVRGYENFTFLRVYNAGHMVPHDQPEIALEMLSTWLDGNYSFE